LVQSLVTVSNVLSEELHVADDSTCVLLSVKVPVAINGWVFPVDIEGVEGLTAIETRLGGVSEFGWYSSELATALAVVLEPPSIKIVPFVSRVAVSNTREMLILLAAE